MGSKDEEGLFGNAEALLASLLRSLSDVPKAALIANSLKSHLILEENQVEKSAHVILWDNAFGREPEFFKGWRELPLSQDNLRLKALRRSGGANTVILTKKKTFSSTPPVL